MVGPNTILQVWATFAGASERDWRSAAAAGHGAPSIPSNRMRGAPAPSTDKTTPFQFFNFRRLS